MALELSPDTLKLLEALVADGYGTADDVIHDALVLLKADHPPLEEPDTETLRALVRESLDDPAPDLTMEEVRAHLARVAEELVADGVGR